MEMKINSNGYPSGDYSNSTLSLALIPRERLEPIKPPKIVSNDKFDLDLLCAQALSRLNYVIEANVVYQLKLIRKEFSILKENQYDNRDFTMGGNGIRFHDFILTNITAHSTGGAGGVGVYEKAFVNGPYISGGGGSGGLSRP